jgi:hypothetical protein
MGWKLPDGMRLQVKRWGGRGGGLQGFASAEQFGQGALNQYLFDGLLVADFSKGVGIHEPPEAQIVEKYNVHFGTHNPRSFGR